MAQEPDPAAIFDALEAQQRQMSAERKAVLEEMMADLRSSILAGNIDGDSLRLYETLTVEVALLGMLESNGAQTLSLMRRLQGL